MTRTDAVYTNWTAGPAVSGLNEGTREFVILNGLEVRVGKLVTVRPAVNIPDAWGGRVMRVVALGKEDALLDGYGGQVYLHYQRLVSEARPGHVCG